MRADIFHASSLLLKYGEYSEANLTHEVSRLLSEKTNLTEALGVSAQLGSVMQATYEEMMESGVFEMKSKGNDRSRHDWGRHRRLFIIMCCGVCMAVPFRKAKVHKMRAAVVPSA
ncbi:unnamed protein product [Cladocopium goreaui]|uniref:Uncharacterized protein n=1 Tax=Cladocopium goreaui TaxID=2562237 RepID=A0A9P1D2A2_9DINO|nr:unnamed protein product [Cladocopium goreaui]